MAGVTVAAVLAASGMAVATTDLVHNDVSASGIQTTSVGVATTVNFYIQDAGGSCDASDGSAATVNMVDPAHVSVSPSSLVFSACGVANEQAASFSADQAGDYAISVTVSDSVAVDGYNTNPAKFTLHVTASTDTMPPVLTLPANITAEATAAAGAQVTYVASAMDAVDGPVPVSCSPTSGSTFPLDVTTTVHCSATDSHNNQATGSFAVTVQDTTAPSVGAGAAITTEATGPTGAVVTYTSPSATDLVDGTDTVTCLPASGSTFAIGVTTVHCSATDAHKNTGTSSFTITVTDTTAPVLSLPGPITAEATGPGGAAVPFTVSASDLVDGVITPQCDHSSGDTFPLGVTTVHCSAMDSHHNQATGSFTVTVQDTTPPALTVPSDQTVEATGPTGAVVSFSASATDAVDGTDSVTCLPASGSTFAFGKTKVTCSATDAHHNVGSSSFYVTVVSDRSEVIGLTSVSISATVTAVDGTGGSQMGTVASDGTVTLSGAYVDGIVTTPQGANGVLKQKNGAAASYATGEVLLSSNDPTFGACGSPFAFTQTVTKGDPQHDKFTYDATKGDLTVSGGNQLTLNGGNYCFHNVTVSGGSKLIVAANTTKPVVIAMTGQFNGSGGSLLNMTYDPVNLQINTKYAGNNAAVLSGGSMADALVFAPNGQVVLSGGSPLTGAILGNTVVMSGNSLVHCDNAADVLAAWQAHFA